MVIHIPDYLLSEAKTSGAVDNLLKLIFYLFERGRHKWYIRNNKINLFMTASSLRSYQELIEKMVVETSNYDNQTEKETEYIVRLSTDAEIKTKKEQLVTEKYISVNEFLQGKRMVCRSEKFTHDYVSVDIAEIFLGQPLNILVENVESDKLFVENCLKYFGEVDVASLWIEFVHGGGTDICKVARNIAGIKRVIIIIDSDKCSPLTEYKSTVEELLDICNKYGYKIHILSKREMENYIPDAALQRYLSSVGNKVENHIYFQLNESDKDYFDLKNGICDKFDHMNNWCKKNKKECYVWKCVSETWDEIAVTSEETEDQQLMQGFGSKVWRAFKYVQTKEELQSRDHSNELDELVDEILSFV